MPATSHPDPERGIFETLLVAAGQPIELDAHLSRLAASLTALFGVTPPQGARDLLLDGARGLQLGRLRLTAVPQPGGDIALEVRGSEVAPSLVFPSAAQAVALRSLVVPGGLGPHKWADRDLLEGAEAAARGAEAGAPGDSVPLLLDRDGAVLEASRANLFAVRDGALSTPPTDGRILPGIARARAIEIAREARIETREEPIALDDLILADAVFLTGSVRGVELVHSVDGVDLHPVGEITRLVAEELRRRWLHPR